MADRPTGALQFSRTNNRWKNKTRHHGTRWRKHIHLWFKQIFSALRLLPPHIAGAAALIKSSNPENFTAQTLRNKLIEATVDLGSRGKDNIYGYGRLDFSLLDLQPRIDVSNVVVSLDLIPGSGAGNQINDSVTSGTVSGQGTKIAVEVFAKGVITPLIGVKIEFEFKAEELKLAQGRE